MNDEPTIETLTWRDVFNGNRSGQPPQGNPTPIFYKAALGGYRFVALGDMVYRVEGQGSLESLATGLTVAQLDARSALVNDGWVHATKHVPASETPCIVWGESWADPARPTEAWYRPDPGAWEYAEGMAIEGVTHWRPMPEPPKPR